MRNSTVTFIGAVVVGLLFIGSIAGNAVIQRTLEETTITVVDKERLSSISSSEGNTKTTFENFVYSDSEVYSVRDSLWNGHFRAMSVYASIPESGTCDVTLSGIRFGLLSMTQNIIAADCHKNP